MRSLAQPAALCPLALPVGPCPLILFPGPFSCRPHLALLPLCPSLPRAPVLVALLCFCWVPLLVLVVASAGPACFFCRPACAACPPLPAFLSLSPSLVGLTLPLCPLVLPCPSLLSLCPCLACPTAPRLVPVAVPAGPARCSLPSCLLSPRANLAHIHCLSSSCLRRLGTA